MGVEFGVVTIADIRIFTAFYFALFAVLVILGTITQGRFYGAYLARYGDANERRRRWPFFPVSLRGWSRPPRTLRSWFQPVDDPLVERRRRQYLLVWGGVGVWFAFPIALIVYGFVFHR